MTKSEIKDKIVELFAHLSPRQIADELNISYIEVKKILKKELK